MQSNQPKSPHSADGSFDVVDADYSDAYRVLFERCADAILIIDGDEFIDCNQATVDMLRYESKEELLKTHPSELSPPRQFDGRDSFEKANEMIETAFTNGSHRFEWDHKRADGEVFPVEVLLTAIPLGPKRILHVVWRDITERKQLETKLRHALKMEAVGKLAGGIAHDFNNLLVAIMGNVELLGDSLEGNEDQLELVQQASWAAGRASELTSQLLAYSRLQVLRPRVLDLNVAVSQLNSLLSSLIGEHLQIEMQLAERVLAVEVDPGQLEQVIINLITNARDAMPRGGVIELETSLVDLDEDSGVGSGELGAGPYAKLTVSDTGSGMSEEVRRLAFDPFFSTKAVGEGTGLGLSTVIGIVKQSHGEVLLSSEPGEGTTVSVMLPLSNADVAPDPLIENTGLRPSGGGETVLLVEDDLSVSRLIERVLRSSGYEVIAAETGRQGLELFVSRADEIGLIVSDVIMPELSGPDMVASIREQGHTPPVLFVSGYTPDVLRRMDVLRDDASLIQKPFGVSSLLQRVREVLDLASLS